MSGIDAGGVKREFFSLLVRDLFSPDFGMFTLEEEQYVFNPMSLTQFETLVSPSNHHHHASSSSNPSALPLSPEALNMLSEYELVGIVLGLSIYNGVQLDIRFPRVYYKKLLAQCRPQKQLTATTSAAAAAASSSSSSCNIPDYSMEDLLDAFPALAKGFQSVLNYEACSSEDFTATFGLTFSVDHFLFGATVSRDLIPNGSKIEVTLENRQAYVDVYTRYLLHDAIKPQFDAFARGFFKVVSKKPLELLTHPSDLELLICGNQTPNFDELELAASYDGFHGPIGSNGRPTAPVIHHFWSFFSSLSIEQKKKVLAFVTGSNRIPIRGLRHSKFVIMHGGDNQDKLPESHVSTHTLCFHIRCILTLLVSLLISFLLISCCLLFFLPLLTFVFCICVCRLVSTHCAYPTTKMLIHYDQKCYLLFQKVQKVFNSNKRLCFSVCKSDHRHGCMFSCNRVK